jgi:hypothetical protein
MGSGGCSRVSAVASISSPAVSMTTEGFGTVSDTFRRSSAAIRSKTGAQSTNFDWEEANSFRPLFARFLPVRRRPPAFDVTADTATGKKTRSHALRGNAVWDALRPRGGVVVATTLRVVRAVWPWRLPYADEHDAVRPGRHSHAGAWERVQPGIPCCVPAEGRVRNRFAPNRRDNRGSVLEEFFGFWEQPSCNRGGRKGASRMPRT